MVDLTPYLANIKLAQQKLSKVRINGNPREDFLDNLVNAGFLIKEIKVGEIQRIDSSTDKKGKKSGWYIYNEIETDHGFIGFGSYGDWKTGFNESWSSKGVFSMTDGERSEYHQKMQEIRSIQEAEKIREQNEAANQAMKIWREASEADNNHQYLIKKGVRVHEGVKQSGEKLIIPVYYSSGITSVQYIYPDGTKRFLKGGKKKGCYFIIKGSDDLVLVCEGYSTGATLHEATGATVYIAFDCGNLFDVGGTVKNNHQGARIIICGDDDKDSEVNQGRIKAEQAANSLGVMSLFPVCKQGTDFNDMAQESGLDSVKSLFKANKDNSKLLKQKDDIMPPSGFLSDVVDYFNAISGNNQPDFAIHTSLALTSVLLSRWFTTNLGNKSSLYYLFIAETGTGKESVKNVIEKILHACDMKHLLGGNGYTSGSAVFSSIYLKPRHITITDEFAKYLEAAKHKNGSSHLMMANSKLVELWGRLTGFDMQTQYAIHPSDLKKMKNNDENLIVYHPAITLVGIAPPEDFASAIGDKEVANGFLNRFLVCISNAEPQIRKHKEPIDVPEKIIDWVNEINARMGNKDDLYSEMPQDIKLDFDAESLMQDEKNQMYFLNMYKELKEFGIEKITARCNEMALRLALICALSENPQAKVIKKHHLDWGFEWSKKCLLGLVDVLKSNVSGSEHEANKKTIRNALVKLGNEGITWSKMLKRPPFSRYEKEKLKKILHELIEAGLAVQEARTTGGRPAETYIAIEHVEVV